MSPRRAGGEKRAEVLNHVVEVLIERGYDRTRFTDVAKVAGVAVSTLQFYFGSRDDMLVEALHFSCEREVVRLAAIEPDAPPWERLVALINHSLDTCDMNMWRVLFEFWYASMHDEELRQQSEKLQFAWSRPFADAIGRGVALGVFKVDNVENMVTFLVGILDGLLLPQVLRHGYYDVDGVRATVLDVLEKALRVN
ncbi:TetR/AcrR family transcriptional regulator [Kibdelosporangium philippinense]|uniref:TetR/AcrR family transcriptional regulator n=1 Tax=Kibdelosporangium philippinense TaxID=211113 RepID=A0ABS8ZBN8_9PSEU|nr:TetR/AcrR family transcriptional regulator [Kibdelosporangium philippinense]MCE7004837.1 TetR/AcrR family transcriptional regulator [Kibdelosporangium philippinense]